MTDSEKKVDTVKVVWSAFKCGPQCIDGGEHKWDGPEVELTFGGCRGGSISCSKCGKLAIEVSMWD